MTAGSSRAILQEDCPRVKPWHEASAPTPKRKPNRVSHNRVPRWWSTTIKEEP